MAVERSKLSIPSVDKPYRMSPDCLPELEAKGGYMATLKYNGWRMLIIKEDSELSFMSRQMIPIKVAPHIREACRELELPNGSVIDTEWLGRRGGVTEELIYPITTMYWEGNWIGAALEEDRWYFTMDKLKFGDVIKPLEMVTSGYADLFDKSKSIHETEGIVLKRKASKLLGGVKTLKNPGWIKVKYKEGASGEYRIA